MGRTLGMPHEGVRLCMHSGRNISGERGECNAEKTNMQRRGIELANSLESSKYSSNFAGDQAHSGEMSQMARLQCLFCEHINSAGAEYCENCDEQLNLQPCAHCEAVDLRTATHCYKCGTPFPPRRGGEYSAVATAVVGGRFAQTPPPASGISRPAELQVQTGLAPLRQPHISSAEMLAPAHSGMGTMRRGRPAAVLAVVLLLMAGAASAYLFRGQLSQVAQSLGLPWPDGRFTAGTLEGPPPQNASAPNAAAKAVAADTVHATPPVAQTSAQPLAVPAAHADAGPTTTASKEGGSRPLPQDPPAAGQCPAAVAALGLCNAGAPQEKPQ